jgi:hypothetical protein
MVLQQLDLLPLIVSAVWLQILALAMPTLLVVNLKRAQGTTQILGRGITSTDLTPLWECLGMTLQCYRRIL